ncbi:EAL domain-containing protein [Mesorhizobium sp. LHD-90]|uniref:putative bifunctional diguanylate cyclase/phosphodiesterase n=1 Tax=Mesorhizobium sp. LHD-90 TaxID=3071414 RepID=UPI0027E05AA4|nr:EAL domain-containing protein [Mesorhizobium sp. LHD-90]MDQ6434318.1 EAL domain-containing protein [Mesorhizobium sp. LHD-90]
MQSLLSAVYELGTGKEWLLAASLLFSALLAYWVVRYRRLYFSSLDDRENNRELVENLSEGIYRSSLEGKQLSANKALVKLNGYDNEPEMLAGVLDIGKEWYVRADRRDEFRAILNRDGKVEDFVSEIYRHKSRERIWITESARLVHDRTTGKPLFYEGSVREITETIRRLVIEEQFRKLTQRLPVGLFHFVRRGDGHSDVLFISEGASRISGIPPEEQIANPKIFDELLFDEDRSHFYETYCRSADELVPWDCEFRIRARDGTEKWVRINAHTEAVNGEINWYGYISDISARKRQEMEIEELAYYDPLTKLPNRRMFLSRMTEALAHCERSGEHASMLFIDLDNFKVLNDTQGHDMGDLLLVRVADRLRSCVETKDIVARIGGDEFVVVVDQTESETALATLKAITAGNRILAELNQGFDLGGQHHVATASIGVVVFNGVSQRADEIMKRADLAMYQAKAAGRNGLALFDAANMDRQSERFELLSDLRNAFTRDQLDLHFQPLVDFTGRVVAAEALVRWNHPKHGQVRPDQFVALAEQYGLNDDLTRFVFDAGFRALADWSTRPAMSHLRLSLNVSVQSFSSDDFSPMVRRLVAKHGIDPRMLTFELTEHVMAKDHQHVRWRMAEIKELGIRLSLDDFGTGYSSLAYLKQLPFDEVKIDGGFVADIEHTESDRALVKTILAMARTLGLKSVAEHVENVRQEAFLRAFGCDYLQGHLYSRALPMPEFEQLFLPATTGDQAAPGMQRQLA